MKALGDLNGDWQENFILVGEGHQVGAGKRQPGGRGKLQLASNGAFRQLPFHQRRGIATVTLPAGIRVPVFGRVEPDGKRKGFPRHRIEAFGDKFDLNLLALQDLCPRKHGQRQQRAWHQQPPQQISHARLSLVLFSSVGTDCTA